jgi:hypothetical protein
MVQSKIIAVLRTGTLAGSIALNIFLAHRILSAPTPHTLEAGSKLPSLAVRDLAGISTEIRAGGLPLIVYFFDESCVWSERNVEDIKVLERKTRGRYRLVGISLSNNDLRQYMDRHGLVFPVYIRPAALAFEPFRIQGTPQTVLISAEGRIIANWTGAYMDEIRRSIQETLAIQLDANS